MALFINRIFQNDRRSRRLVLLYLLQITKKQERGGRFLQGSATAALAYPGSRSPDLSLIKQVKTGRAAGPLARNPPRPEIASLRSQ
jgi:hypothetical protein